MKIPGLLLVVALVGSGMQVPELTAREPDQASKYHLRLIYIYERNEFIFGVGDMRFNSVSSLKGFIAGLPPGSTLEWAPGCIRVGNEPLLSSETAMKHFVRFCERKGIKFILVPSG